MLRRTNDEAQCGEKSQGKNQAEHALGNQEATKGGKECDVPKQEHHASNDSRSCAPEHTDPHMSHHK